MITKTPVSKRWKTHILTLLLVVVELTEGFVPGFTARTYKSGEKIDIKVNGLTSVKAQLPYSYYHLPYCRPNVITSHVESLGEILMGETVENSPYDTRMLRQKSCEVLCRIALNDLTKSRFKQLIDDEYTVQWLSDGLPAVFPHPHSDLEAPEWYSVGFPIGWKEFDPVVNRMRYFLYNYISIVFKYRNTAENRKEPIFLRDELLNNTTDSSGQYQIVGFEVVPISFNDPDSIHKGSYCESLKVSDSKGNIFSKVERAFLLRQYISEKNLLDLDLTNEITFLYDVMFQESNIHYTQRWDTYLQSQSLGLGENSSMEIHWFSIVNSLVVVLVLSGIVAMILVRTLHRDIAKYNELVLNSEEDESEESGWKLVHGDVFRKPQHSTILAALVGSGIQILSMVVVTLTIASIGVGLYPSTGFKPGRLLQAALLLWSLMGVAGGYTSARFYKLFQSPNWKMTTIRTALMYPGVVFSIFITVNVFARFTHSSAAVPFGAIFLLMLIWFGISTPLIFIGAYFGYKKETVQLPCRVTRIPRAIPSQPWTAHPVLCCLAGGALPFSAAFTELMFIFSSLWQHRTYMLFGLLLLVTFILIVTCAEISITMIYFQLGCQDYNWWFRSFFVAGTSGVFVFAYSLIYICTRLSLSHFTAIVLYLGYAIVISYTFFILTGTIGFIACFLFVRAIYGSIRVD